MSADHQSMYESNDAFGVDPANYMCSSSNSSPMDIFTPLSTRRESFADPIKFENSFSLSMSNFGESFGSTSSVSSISATTNDSMAFSDHSLLFDHGDGKAMSEQSMFNIQGIPAPMYEPFGSQMDLLGNAPALELGLSSPTSGSGSPPDNFIDPAFINTYDMHIHTPLPSERFEGIQTPDYGFSLGNSPAEDSKHIRIYYDDVKSASSTPSKHCSDGYLRPQKFEDLQASVALQQVQDDKRSDRKTRMRMKRELGAFPIKVQSQAKKPCSWPGCSSRFQRQEHLKRHEKTHLKIDVFTCYFCPDGGKNFGRADNLKNHVLLHMNLEAKKSARTLYHPDAAAEYARMGRKSRRSGYSVEIGGKRVDPDCRSRSARSRVEGYRGH